MSGKMSGKMNRWLNIVGVTEEGISGLSPIVGMLVRDAKHLIGPERLLPHPPRPGQTAQQWQPPLDKMLEQVMALRGKPTTILASGDPNWFGIGSTLTRHLDRQEFAIHPAPSSFQLAAARLHWPLQQVQTISLHGREVSHLHPHLFAGARILALTSDRHTLRAVGSLLKERGFAQSQLTILQDIGGPAEKRLHCSVAEAETLRTGDFYVLAMEAIADDEALILPGVAGLPDAAFVSDGQLTKRDVRAATLARLAPLPNALLWDVGAGCGSIGIEWMRAARNARAIAFEQKPGRVEMINTNRLALGATNLQVIPGSAPDSFKGVEPPDAIFLGGNVGNNDLFSACWAALKPRGRMVANAVTLDGEKALFDRQARFGGELVRLEISVLDQIGQERVFRPRMAVTQWAVTRGLE